MITAKNILYIDLNGNKQGNVETKKILCDIDTHKYDLVQVSKPNTIPIICKLFEKQAFTVKTKQDKINLLKTRKKTKIKEVQLGTSISDHDLNVKLSKMENFLDDGYRVKITIESKGIEPKTPETICKLILEKYNENCNILMEPKKEGKTLTFIINKK